MASRSIFDLQPAMRTLAENFLEECTKAKLEVLIYCTYRTPREQAILYRKPLATHQIIYRGQVLANTYGRKDLQDCLLAVGPQSGRKVTNAAPGQSLHNYGLAFDGCPVRHGKPVWGVRGEDGELWESYGACAKRVGLAWAGEWTRFREFPHCQLPGANWRDMIREHQWSAQDLGL